MVPETRRSLLSGVAGLAVALAGCSGLTGSGESSRTDDGPAPDGPGSGSESDPETLLLRSDTDRRTVWLGERDEQTPRRRDPIHDPIIVDAEAKADRLSVADGVDRDRLDAFLDATDFDAETLYVQGVRVEECFRLDLCRIEWQPDQISTDYVRRIRPYTDSCAVENRVVETRLIRIPDALDADDVNGFGTGVGTGSCTRGPRAESGGGSGSAATGGGE